MWGIFCGILTGPQNIVMNLSNVMIHTHTHKPIFPRSKKVNIRNLMDFAHLVLSVWLSKIDLFLLVPISHAKSKFNKSKVSWFSLSHVVTKLKDRGNIQGLLGAHNETTQPQLRRNYDLSKYGQKAWPNLVMHLRAFFSYLGHAHCTTNYLKNELEEYDE